MLLIENLIKEFAASEYVLNVYNIEYTIIAPVLYANQVATMKFLRPFNIHVIDYNF